MDVKFNLYNISYECHTGSCYTTKHMSSFWVLGESFQMLIEVAIEIEH